MKRYLPPGLRARTAASGNTFYYLKLAGANGEMPLGQDRRQALQEWQRHRVAQFVLDRPSNDLVTVIDCFITCSIQAREPDNRRALLRQADALRRYFFDIGNPVPGIPLPAENAYLEHRGPALRYRAGAEIYLLLHIWNWAQQSGLLRRDIPCPWDSRTIVASRERALSNELREAVLKVLNPDPQEAADDAPQNRALLEAIRRQIVSQLVADGRPDMARHFRSLTAAEFHELFLNLGDATSLAAKSNLVLGTQRATRLQALRADALRTGRKPLDSDN
jgi:hypothetical protein